jgi:ABC-type glycerol-3-phosphate transport system substrate-binding protein
MLNRQEVVLNVVIMGSMVNTDNLTLLDDELTKELLSKEEADSTDVSVRFINFSSDSMSPDTAMGVQKMAAELSAKSIDVFIINKDLFTDMSSDGQLLSLEELEGFDKNVFAEEQLYTSGEGKINGISTLNLKMFDEIIYNEEELIIAVPMNFQNKDKTSEFFKLVK